MPPPSGSDRLKDMSVASEVTLFGLPPGPQTPHTHFLLSLCPTGGEGLTPIPELHPESDLVVGS